MAALNTAYVTGAGKGQKSLENNGLIKYLERFCKMTNLAVRLEWVGHTPFQAYKLKFYKVEREYLTKEELAMMEAKKFNMVRLQYRYSGPFLFLITLQD